MSHTHTFLYVIHSKTPSEQVLFRGCCKSCFDTFTYQPLFPLDRGGGLACDVVADAVGAGDLGHDAAADLGQHLVGQLGPVCRHGVAGLNGAQDDGALVGALVAHDTHRLDVGQNSEVLPAGVLAVALPRLLEGLFQSVSTLSGKRKGLVRGLFYAVTHE